MIPPPPPCVVEAISSCGVYRPWRGWQLRPLVEERSGGVLSDMVTVVIAVIAVFDQGMPIHFLTVGFALQFFVLVFCFCSEASAASKPRMLLLLRKVKLEPFNRCLFFVGEAPLLVDQIFPENTKVASVAAMEKNLPVSSAQKRSHPCCCGNPIN